MDRPKSLLRLALALSLAGCRAGGTVTGEPPPPSSMSGVESGREEPAEPAAAEPRPSIGTDPASSSGAAAAGTSKESSPATRAPTAPETAPTAQATADASTPPARRDSPPEASPTEGTAGGAPEIDPGSAASKSSGDAPLSEDQATGAPEARETKPPAGTSTDATPPDTTSPIAPPPTTSPAESATTGTGNGEADASQVPDARPPGPIDLPAPVGGASGTNDAESGGQDAGGANPALGQGTAPPTDEERELLAELERAKAAQEWERVGILADRLRALPSLSKARALHAQGLWREELDVLERALQKTPEEVGLLLAAGSVRLILVERADTPETERRALLVAARDGFHRAQATSSTTAAAPDVLVQALLGESRAARRLGDARAALDSARRALAELALQRELRLSQEPAAEVVLAEAGLEVYRELAAAEPAAAEGLFTELVGALRLRAQEKSTDSLAHARLCELYLEAGRVEDAMKAAKRGLGASPGDAPLFELATRAARRLGGADEVLRFLRELREQFPNQPLVHWHLAREYFSASVDGVLLSECENETEQLAKAERWFRRARELDPRRERECRGHEALTRALAGWRLIDEDRLREARIAFLSMNDVAPGAIAVDPASLDARWVGRARNGIEGLERIAAIHREKRAFVLAAEVGTLIARELSSDPRRAREAAEAAKDAADGLAEESDALEQASRGEIKDPEKLKRLRKWAGVSRERDFGTDKERDKFQREALARRRSASEWYGRSWSQYLRAVELDPLDARLATDAARVAIRHTRQELGRAGELLSGAVRIAEDRAGDPALKPDEKNQLLVSWADAEQALGELDLDVRDDPVAAARHFQKSLQVMPGPRPQVSETLLPKARARARERGLPDPAPDLPEASDPKGASESPANPPREGGSATGRPSRDNPN